MRPRPALSTCCRSGQRPTRPSGARALKMAPCVCSAIRTARRSTPRRSAGLSVSLWFKADTTNPTRYTSTSANGGSTSGTSVAMPLFESGDSASGLNIYIYNNRLYVGAWNSGRLAGRVEPSCFRRERHRCRPLAPRGAHARSHRHTASRTACAATLTASSSEREMAQRPAGRDIGIGRTYGTTRFLLGTGGASVVSNDTPASNNHRGFAGYVDEARVYGETLSATDVTDIRTATAPTVPEESWLIRDSGRAATIGDSASPASWRASTSCSNGAPDCRPTCSRSRPISSRISIAWKCRGTSSLSSRAWRRRRHETA